MTIKMMKLAILLLGVIAGQAYGDAPEAIVGGNNAAKGQFPHQVSIRYRDGHWCGGSIIGNDIILTAGHCMSNDLKSMTVVPGITNVKDPNAKIYNIKNYIIHPGYNPNSLENDICIMKLSRPIPFNALQKPIALAPKGFVTDGKTCIVSGWGQLGVNQRMSEDLQYVTMKGLPLDQCRSYSIHSYVTNKQVCTLADRAGKGACHGDSGGPLICDRYLVGIVSWGKPCAVGEPDVFTRVSEYHNFIDDCIRRLS